jgi:hypothetical protein
MDVDEGVHRPVDDVEPENKTKAGSVGAIEAAVSAMREHAQNDELQVRACEVLAMLSHKNAENKTKEGNAGAIEAILVAMSGHPGNRQLKRIACFAVQSMITDHAENM